MTMTLVSTVTVGSGGAASIDFTSIPQTATDLFVVLNGRSTSTAHIVYMTVNGLTGASDYTSKYLRGNGSGVVSSGTTGTNIYIGSQPTSAYAANTFGNFSVYIPNYAGATNKSISSDTVSEDNATTAYQMIAASVVNNTGAITSIKFEPASANSFAQYSTASLYTITKGSGGATVS